MASSMLRTGMTGVAAGCVALLLAGAAAARGGVEPATATEPGDAGRPASTYRVNVLGFEPPRLSVTADLPIDGRDLRMATTRPGGIPELDAHGWPGLIVDLRVVDAAGEPLALAGAGDAGWKLAHPHRGRITLHYEVDYAPLAARGWPAPREAVFTDASHLVLIGRSLFISTPQTGSSVVAFDLPGAWNILAPWERRSGSGRDFAVEGVDALVDNLLALTTGGAETVSAGGFQLHVLPMGHWRPARDEVRRVMEAVIPQLVALMRFEERDDYLVVLLPIEEDGGESFRNSFAMTAGTTPSRANSTAWGNLLAHEVFHYWNGSRLIGADYAASQWFQEGFTEYAANLAMTRSGMIDPGEFVRKLSDHLRNSRRLTTTLEAGGSRKGPPLYGAGALVAFSWDLLIRDATQSRRSLGDVLRALWDRTGGGRRPYAWREIEAALDATAPRDWDSFYRAHIRGSEPLPLGAILPLAGLRLAGENGDAPRIDVDPAASAAARMLWAALIEGR